MAHDTERIQLLLVAITITFYVYTIAIFFYIS